MTCRIEQLTGEEGIVVFRVSGRIRSGNVSTLEELIARESGQIAIDMGELMLVDRDVVSYLAACEMRGIDLRNCPPFLREWLTREQSR
jgi:hypothetical protein